MTDQVFDGTRPRGHAYDTTIAEGGTAQVIFESEEAQRGWAIYNPSATDWLWVSSSTEAAPNGVGSIPIAPLGGYETPPLYRPCGYVSVYGATTGQPITGRCW